jgi:hypothetical protein
MKDGADRAIDPHVAGRKDQVTETRRLLLQMTDKANRAIDDQVARSTPMTP